MDSFLIAPCGINCALCLAYQRTKNHCPGCRDKSQNVPEHRARCVIKNCETMAKNNWEDCSPCESRCLRLKRLNKRYKEKYNTDIFENFNQIKDHGMDAFLEKQKEKWTCPQCGNLICMHRGFCMNCSKKAPSKT
jgi:hypothetical protein